MRGVVTTAMNSISGFAAADYCGGIPSPQDEKKDPNNIESDDVTYDDTSRPSGVSARSVCMGGGHLPRTCMIDYERSRLWEVRGTCKCPSAVTMTLSCRRSALYRQASQEIL